VLTATAFEEDLKIVEDLPAVDDFLPKPFEPQRLRDAVQKLLEK
jgi:CheY-like chemotaxis protein